MLTCLIVPAASARQDSDSGTQGKKSSTAKETSHTKSSAKSSTATKSKTGSTHSTSGKKHSSRKKSARVRGQEKIDSGRAQAIQEALIREHYLNGEATGTWNQQTEDALRKYQADRGWQSKTVPDSRAIISLGLGPSKDHLLNPESAMTTVPDRPRSETVTPTSHTTPAVADPVAPSSSVPAATPGTGDPSGPQ